MSAFDEIADLAKEQLAAHVTLQEAHMALKQKIIDSADMHMWLASIAHLVGSKATHDTEQAIANALVRLLK